MHRFGDLIFFRGITVPIINLVLIIPITLALASHNSGAIQRDIAIAKPSDILNASTVPSRLAIINFDDGFQNLGVDYESLPYGKILHRLVVVCECLSFPRKPTPPVHHPLLKLQYGDEIMMSSS